MTALAILLLAAGRSRRFGAADKLVALLGGRAVVDWAVAAQSGLDARRVAVVGPNGGVAERLAAAGFECVVNPDDEAGQGRSLALGTRAVLDEGAERMLVMLGDMPLVTPGLLARLLSAGDHAAAWDGMRPGPPALFPGRLFASLAALDGEEGARGLLSGAVRVAAGAGELTDIDTNVDIHALSTTMGTTR